MSDATFVDPNTPTVVVPQPDHTSDDPAPAEANPPLTDEERSRVVQQRAMRAQTDAEKTEMDALNLREAELAGHTVPDAKPAPELNAAHRAVVQAFEAIAYGFAHIADTTATGSLGPLGRIAAELRGHVDTLKDPEAAARREQEAAAAAAKMRQAAADRAAAREATAV